ncbi:MAG TPA: glucosaminidase domain-containing protein [Terriglobales bacterium]|nr:glucosaminidase domain-containing protein [Terriglobales bacterium]
MTKPEFIAAATAAAHVSSAASGFPPGVTVAQAALESAWGQSQLARLANNYFGIKAHGDLPWIELPTIEVQDGAAVKVRAYFARYPSTEACFEDRDRLIARLAVYAEARAAVTHPEAFIRALAKHWATDPHYAEKLLAVYREHGFDKLDQAFSTQQSALSQ